MSKTIIVTSSDKVNELLSHNNTAGITVGHDGSVYYYTRPNRKITPNVIKTSVADSRIKLDHVPALNVLRKKVAANTITNTRKIGITTFLMYCMTSMFTLGNTIIDRTI